MTRSVPYRQILCMRIQSVAQALALALAGGMVSAACTSHSGTPSGTGGNSAAGVTGAGGAGSCSSVTPCGGDVVGTWTVTSSCLKVTGNVDVMQFGLGCTSVSVTGSLQVTGTWTAKSDGTFTDATTTAGTEQITLAASCLQVSGTTTTCDRIGGLLQGVGYASVTCTDATGGGCT